MAFIKLTQDLVQAIKDDDINRVRELVEIGADIRTHNNYIFRYITANGKLEMLKYLVSLSDIRFDISEALIYASKYGHLEMVKYLVLLGANISSYDNFAIRYASHYGNLDIVKFLISKGADYTFISYSHKCHIFGVKIYKFYKMQKTRKHLNKIIQMIIPIYFAPEMKGGYFAKKSINNMLDMLKNNA